MGKNESTVTDVNEVLGALDGGLLAEKIGVALSEIALATCTLHEHTDGKARGKIILKLEVACADPVEGLLRVTHDMVQVVPKKEGQDTSQRKGKAVMFAQRGGKMVETQPPENLRGQFLMDFED